MDRPRGAPRQRAVQTIEVPAREQPGGWPVVGLVGTVTTLGLVGAAGFLAYRYMSGSRASKKSRSKHGKKDKAKKKVESDEEAPSPKQSSPPSPRTPPRAASPPVQAKPVADSSRLDQLAWWVEIAKDQFEARSLKHAKYYCDKALALGESVSDFTNTLSYSQMRYIKTFVMGEHEGKLEDLKTYVVRFLSTLFRKPFLTLNTPFLIHLPCLI